jgi:hypothetical protein
MKCGKNTRLVLGTMAATLMIVFAASCTENPASTGSSAPAKTIVDPREMPGMPPPAESVAPKVEATAGVNIQFVASCPTAYPSTSLSTQYPYAYVTSFTWEPRGALEVIDITTGHLPVVVGSYDCPQIGCLRLPIDVHAQGQFAWVADFCATPEFGPHLYEFNVATPTNPFIASWDGSPGNPRNVFVSQGKAYEASFDGGMSIYNTNPLWWQSSTDVGRTAMDVCVVGNYAYVAEYWMNELPAAGSLVIFDISRGRVPIEVSRIRTWGENAFAVSLSSAATSPVSPHAYMADLNGLMVFNVADPRNPTRVTHLSLPGTVRWVFAQGRYAYVAAGDAGVYVINISNPQAPYIAGHYDTSGWAMAVQPIGNLLYVADYDGGFLVLRFLGEGFDS